MNAKKLYFGLITLLTLLGAGMFFSVYAANNMLDHTSDTLTNLKAAEQAVEVQKTQLAKNKNDVATYSDLNTIAKSVVPQDKNQAEAVREIVNLAGQSGISRLSSITFPASTLGAKTKGKTGALTQVTPVKGISGVFDLQITVQQSDDDAVSYSSFTSFLRKLEQNRRTAQVSSINVTPNQKDPSKVAFTLVIDEFIKP